MAARNFTATLTKDKKLLLEIDLTRDLGPSSSGKSRLIAVGSLRVPGNVCVSLTVYSPLPGSSAYQHSLRLAELPESDDK